MTYPTSAPIQVKIEVPDQGTMVDRTSLVPADSIYITNALNRKIDTADLLVRDCGPRTEDDEAGSSWGPANHRLSLEDATAMIRVEGMDLSPYVGDAATELTPYRLDLFDSEGRRAQGFIGPADAALAVGAELLSNEGFETPGGGGADIWANWSESVSGDGALANETTIVHSGDDACKTSSGTVDHNTRLSQAAAVTAGKLYRLRFWTRGTGSGQGGYAVYDATNGVTVLNQWSGVSGTVYTQVDVFFTAPEGCSYIGVFLYCSKVDSDDIYYDDVSLKNVTHIGTDGVYIVADRDLITSNRGWESIENLFDYNDSAYTFHVIRVALDIGELHEILISAPDEAVEDATGSSWGPAVHRINLRDGEAAIRVQGVPLNSFKGVLGEETPFRIDLYDSSLKLARGYIVERDSPLALGAELLNNPGFETPGGGGADIWVNWTESASDGALANEVVIVHGGADAAKITAGPSLNTFVYQQHSVMAGRLYKLTYWTQGDGTHAGRYRIRDVTNEVWITALATTGVTGAPYEQITAYFTAPSGCEAAGYYFFCPWTDTRVAYFDDVSSKEVTHVGADGVHIVDTQNGNQRGWASIEGGFDYNDSAYTFDIICLRRYFAGYVTIEEKEPRGIFLDKRLACQDYTYRLDRTALHEEYEDMADTAIIKAAFEKYLPIIEPTTFVIGQLSATDLPLERYNRVSLRQVMDRLTDAAEGDWYVDYGPASPPEMITDGVMEDNPTVYWTKSNVDLDEETGAGVPYEGSMCLKVTAVDDIGFCYQNVAVFEDLTYELNAYVKASAGDTWFISVYDVTNSTTIWSDTGTNTAWELQTQEVTIPKDCVHAIVCIGAVNDTDIVWYDAVSFKRSGQKANLHYFPGGSEPAPYRLSDDPDFATTFPLENLRVTRDATDHMNRVTVFGGHYLGPDTDHYLPSDGVQLIVPVPYALEPADGYTTPRVYRNTGFTLGANLLSNPGFENPGGGGADIWANWAETAGDGTLVNDVAHPHSGVDAAKATGGATQNTKIEQDATVVAGFSYWLSYWVYMWAGWFEFSWYSVYDNDNAEWIIEKSRCPHGLPDWEWFYTYFTAPTGCTSVKLALYCASPAAGQSVSYDDVAIQGWTPVWTEQTVGLEFVDDPADFDVLWNKAEKHLVFKTPPMDDKLSVKITGRHLISLETTVADYHSFDLYGIWLDDVIVDEEIVDKDVAWKIAKGELMRSAVVDRIQCTVREPGLRAGQSIRIKNTPAELDNWYVVQQVRTRFPGGGTAEFNLEIASTVPRH